MKPKFTLEEARGIYAKYGDCNHEHLTEPFEIPGCHIKITQCKVCAKEIERVYC